MPQLNKALSSNIPSTQVIDSSYSGALIEVMFLYSFILSSLFKVVNVWIKDVIIKRLKIRYMLHAVQHNTEEE